MISRPKCLDGTTSGREKAHRESFYTDKPLLQKKTDSLVHETGTGELGLLLAVEHAIERLLVVVVAQLLVLVDAADVDNGLALAQLGLIASAQDIVGRKLWQQFQHRHRERFVAMERAVVGADVLDAFRDTGRHFHIAERVKARRGRDKVRRRRWESHLCLRRIDDGRLDVMELFALATTKTANDTDTCGAWHMALQIGV